MFLLPFPSQKKLLKRQKKVEESFEKHIKENK
jgi:hypothetical protein